MKFLFVFGEVMNPSGYNYDSDFDVNIIIKFGGYSRISRGYKNDTYSS